MLKTKEKTDIVYKVVTADGRSIISEFYGSFKPYVVDYEVGKWAYPAEGTKYLYAFDTYEDALKFAENNFGEIDKLKIFEAEATGVVRDRVCASVLSVSIFGKFWNCFSKKHPVQYYSTISAPSGSVWCRKIKLLEEMEMEIEI